MCLTSLRLALDVAAAVSLSSSRACWLVMLGRFAPRTARVAAAAPRAAAPPTMKARLLVWLLSLSLSSSCSFNSTLLYGAGS